MSINKWMYKEVVIHIHIGILLSHKKECIWVSSNEVDEPKAYYTQRSKSERERQILHINVCVCMYVCVYIYMESRKTALINLSAGQQWRYRHRDQACGHSRGRRRRDELKEWHGNTWITICKTDSQWEFAVWHLELKPGALWQPRELGGRGHMYIYGWFMMMDGRN